MSERILFEISEELKSKGISEIAKENNTIVLDYKNDSIRFDIDHNSWGKTIKNFEDSSEGIINDPLLRSYLKSFFSQRYNDIISDIDSFSTTKTNGKQIVKTFKYTNNGKIDLHEAIILDGKPVFIKYNQNSKRIEIVEQIVETTRIIKPPSAEEYPYTPYEFTSIEELKDLIEWAKTITLDEIYIKSLSIFSQYNDQDNHIIVLLTADSIWTYFQDLFPTTHYSEGVGTNDVGKSSLGYTFEYTAYRAVKATEISGPNYYRILGTIEPGQCVIIEDEGDSISEDPDKVKILKSGYEYNGRVPKINMNTRDQVQQWFKTYCYKLILAEKSLKEYKARGLVDRTFSFAQRPGTVKQPIKPVVANTQKRNPRLQRLYDELINFRKLMLCYRLVHYNDELPEIETGLKNRDSELCNPILQLFYGTQAIKEIIPTLEIFVKQRRDRRSSSLEAALYPIIKKTINLIKNDALYNYKNIVQIPFSEIWNRITEEDDGIEGNLVNSNEYETCDYGVLYKNSLSKFISDTFGATIRRKSKGSILLFDLDKFQKFEEIYGNNTKSNQVHIDVNLVSEEEAVSESVDIGTNQLQKIDEERSSNDEVKIDIQSGDYSIDVGNVGINKCVDPNRTLIDENVKAENEESIDNSISIDEGNVGYVGNVGISGCVSTIENTILTNNDSMKATTKNNNLPIFNYNNELLKNDKKRDIPPLEPTQPTQPTSSRVEDSSKLQCPLCAYKGIEIDLSVHLFENHKGCLRQLKYDSLDLNARTDYMIEEIKLKQRRIENLNQYDKEF